MPLIDKLYSILTRTDEKIVVQLTSKLHPLFEAHFPDNPILPGFCHIEILSEILEDDIVEISLLKLRKKTFPNETISYNMVTQDRKRKVKILNNDNQLIGNITYIYTTLTL